MFYIISVKMPRKKAQQATRKSTRTKGATTPKAPAKKPAAARGKKQTAVVAPKKGDKTDGDAAVLAKIAALELEVKQLKDDNKAAQDALMKNQKKKKKRVKWVKVQVPSDEDTPEDYSSSEDDEDHEKPKDEEDTELQNALKVLADRAKAKKLPRDQGDDMNVEDMLKQIGSPRGNKKRNKEVVSSDESEPESLTRVQKKKKKGPKVDPLYGPVNKDALSMDQTCGAGLSNESVAKAMVGILDGNNDFDNSSLSEYIDSSTVDQKIKIKIWSGQYVDLGCLAPRSDIRQKESETFWEKLTNSSPKYRPPSNVDEWRRWFSTYSAIYVAKYPKSGPEIIEYMNRIYGLHCSRPNTYIWRLYDEEFRKKKFNDVTLKWDEINDKCLRFVEEQHAVWLKKKNQNKNANPQNQKNQKQNGTCNFWNKGQCKRESCNWKHVCSLCSGDHKKSVCKSKPQNQK